MPERPDRPDLIHKVQDQDRRIRDLERVLVFPSDDPGDELNVLDNGVPLGPADRLDFGAGVTATLIGDRYVLVTAVGAQAAEFDAVVDFLAETDEDLRLFGGATGISDALTFLQDEGLTHAAVLVRATGTYTEVANWTNPAQVLLFGVPGSGSAGTDGTVKWEHAGFSGSSAGWDISNFDIDFGAKGTGFANGGTTAFQARNTIFDCSALTGSRILTDAEIATYHNCAQSRAATLGASVYVKGHQIRTSGSITIALATQFIQGDIIYSGSGTDTWTLPSASSSPTVLSIGLSVLARLGAGTPDLVLTCDTNGGVYKVHSDSGLVTVTANGGHAQLYLTGSFADLTLAAPASGQNPTHVAAEVNGELDITGPAVLSVGVAGSSDHTFRGSQVSGSITADDTTDTNGTWLDFIAADRCSLIVSSSTGNGGTRIPWAFDGSCDNNILVFRDSSGFAAAGTGHGVNGNLIVPDSFFVPAAAPTAGWGSITNVTTDRVYDADSTTIDELADTLGTLIDDLINQGVLAT